MLVFPNFEIHINGIILFCVWLLLINIWVVRFNLIAHHSHQFSLISSLIFILEEYSIIWVIYKVFIYSTINRHLNCPVWTFMNVAIMNTLVHIFWYTYIFYGSSFYNLLYFLIFQLILILYMPIYFCLNTRNLYKML